MNFTIPLVCAAGLLLSDSAAAQSVVTQWAPGTVFPGGLDYNETTQEIWIADESAVLLNQYDRQGTLIGSFPTPGTLPIGVGCDPATNMVWLGDESEIVYEMDGSTGLPTGVQWTVSPAITDLSGVAFNPTTGTIWISQDSGVRTAAEFDTAGNLLQSINLTNTGSIDPDGLAFNPLTNTLFLGDDTLNLLIEVDMAGVLVNSWDMGALGVSPEGVGLDLANGLVIISDGAGANTVFEIDGILTPAPTGPSLAVGGTCPGVQTLDASGMTPAGLVAFYYALAPGSTTLPSGGCAGLTLPVAAPTQLGGFLIADGSGNVSFPGASQPNHCGLVILGAVDVATCTGTNTVML